ncbi:hypothetical protein ACF1BE_24360 [Streptomyces sp. NPDC014991]|uniref:hypothetical protein n=1 Tax=Streptomyces sp. NPDC014991 TaxID=3364935 RepID=UPI0036FE1164
MRIDESPAPPPGPARTRCGPGPSAVGGYALMGCEDRAEALERTRRSLRMHGPEWQFACGLRETAEGRARAAARPAARWPPGRWSS